MSVIVAHEKHGIFIYKTALGLLEQRIDLGEYYNWDDGNPKHQWGDRAEAVLHERSEAKAWAFLRERKDHEYEYIERQEVQ